MALKTCGSKKRSRPVTATLSRTRWRWPFEATQRGRVRVLSSSSTPGIGCSSRSSTRAVRARIVSKNSSESGRPKRLSTAAQRVARFLPKPRARASSVVAGKFASTRHSPSTRANISSLSTSTPSQSKITRSGTRRLRSATRHPREKRGSRAPGLSARPGPPLSRGRRSPTASTFHLVLLGPWHGLYDPGYSDLSPLEWSWAMPRFCANLGFLFGEMPFLDRFEAAARAGFTGVEYASPYDHPAPELRARLKAAGLTQVLINSPAGNRAAGERGMACLPGRVAAFRDSVNQALDYAVALDCKLVHVMAGVPPEDVARDTAAALYAANLAWAAEQAVAAGVKLVLEPLNPRDAPGYLLRTQEQGAATGADCSSTSTTARPPRAM